MKRATQEHEPPAVFEAGPMTGRASPGGSDVEGTAPEQQRTSILQRIEETVTIGFFLVMFVTVLAAVIFRFVFNSPLVWTTGVATAAYIWVLTVGSGLSNRDDDHIQFDLVYEHMPPLGKLLARIAGNLLIIVPFTVAIPGTVEFLKFVAFDQIPGTFIHFNWAYGGILVLLVATVLHRGRLFALDLRTLITHNWGKS